MYTRKGFPRRLEAASQEIIVPSKAIIHAPVNEAPIEVMWEHFVQNEVLLRTFHGFNGVGKHFSVNGKRIFSSEMHPMSGIQSLYDAMGKKLLRLVSFLHLLCISITVLF